MLLLSMNPEKLVCFLKDRIYLIDINKFSKEKTTFTVEESFKNYQVTVSNNLIGCSCNKTVVCKHAKFIIEKLNNTKTRRCKSYNSLNDCQRLFYVDIQRDLDPNLFRTDKNPRYKEYKILEDADYTGNCYICLEKLNKKIIRCKTCDKYYHDKCIYGWLRTGPMCTCPNCRGQWI